MEVMILCNLIAEVTSHSTFHWLEASCWAQPTFQGVNTFEEAGVIRGHLRGLLIREKTNGNISPLGACGWGRVGGVDTKGQEEIFGR